MSTLDLSKNALSNRIAEHITEQIITGELKPGEKLIENTYAEEYGTSRAPVREAIFLLSIEGLVERIPRKGAVVKGYTEAEIYDLLEIRTMLESLAMKRIEEHGVDTEVIEKMDQVLQEMKDEKAIKKYTQYNYAFHMCLIEMSKSQVIKNVYSRLELPLQRVQSLSFANEGKIEKSVSEHSIIVRMLKDGKIAEAARILEKHNSDVIESIQKSLAKAAWSGHDLF
ncbi:GntR family transcriptional regulator [Brevibacillus massiliensis]|jgi:DNA-binding GntR family transcriptional regulator|uniref:GntR family transcriptional regulator n=1 Tax=Brevibacillus massiliensis TaxID=1118054 RepID=UPI0002F5CE60|nr:GntR family transcriptional regulator [Brevibacillus massiliensis]